MEIMLSHLGVGMAYDALDGLDVHAQRLHLRYISVAAAVGCEQADIARFFQRFAEYIPEMRGVLRTCSDSLDSIFRLAC